VRQLARARGDQVRRGEGGVERADEMDEGLNAIVEIFREEESE